VGQHIEEASHVKVRRAMKDLGQAQALIIGKLAEKAPIEENRTSATKHILIQEDSDIANVWICVKKDHP
jgi:hypothetical protein